MAVIDLATGVDQAVQEAVTALRIGPLTTVMTLLSAWWVKSLIPIAVGALADLRRRPAALPPTPLLVLIALVAASLTSTVLKVLFDRVRPALAGDGVTAIGHIPGDASFPSGHAATAFAAAGVLGAMHPRLRVPALGLAALIAVSRVYLGVHYPSDVLAGAALGLAVAAVIVALARRVGAAPGRPRVLPRPRQAGPGA